MKIVFTGGGTGGHVYPLVAIIRATRKLYPKKDLQLYYVGPKDDFGTVLLAQEDIVIKNIISGKIRRYFDVRNVLDILIKIPLGILQSFFMLLILRPKLVFSKGGSGSISVAVAARLLGIPVFIHESDVVPGLSNQRAGAWARKIFISFPKTEYFNPNKTVLVGNPIREEVLQGSREDAQKMFNLTLFKPVILIIGGSQGAEAINDFILSNITHLVEKYEIVHVTGQNNFKSVQAEAQAILDKDLQIYYHPYAFLNEDQTKNIYRVADLIVSRSGSGSIFEIAAVGKPAILIPLPNAASNHQVKNAYLYAQTGAALVIEQASLTPNFFLDSIRAIVDTKGKSEQMQKAASLFAKPLAAKTIAREILEFLTIV